MESLHHFKKLLFNHFRMGEVKEQMGKVKEQMGKAKEQLSNHLGVSKLSNVSSLRMTVAALFGFIAILASFTLNKEDAVSFTDFVNTVEERPDDIHRKTLPKGRYQPNNIYNPLGKGFNLNVVDIVAKRVGGAKIFGAIDNKCVLTEHGRESSFVIEHYKDIRSFYESTATATGLVEEMVGKFTMGATLNFKTSALSSGDISVRGSSLRKSVVSQINTLDRNCYSVNSNLDSTFVKGLEMLPVEISDPKISTQWESYNDFLSVFGSHVVTQVSMGSSIRQWSFSNSVKQYSEKDLQISACVSFEGPSKVGTIGIPGCRKWTSKEIKRASKRGVYSHVDVLGGSDETRSLLLEDRTSELIEKLMDEGRFRPYAIDHRYVPIWEIIEAKFIGYDLRSIKMRARASNLRQYYLGFLCFGCSHQSIGNIDTRYFAHDEKNRVYVPRYKCELIARGCHSDDDCHLGGFFNSVTYCYGNSCYAYEDPDAGHTAKNVVARTHKQGSYNEGSNKSCYWHAHQGKCNTTTYSEEKVWSFKTK